jgi:hypothetical protein
MSDLVKYDTYEKFEINRKKKLDDVREHVKKVLNLKNQVALWSLHNRENNTFRVGQFLSSKHLSMSMEDIIKDGEITNISRKGARNTIHIYVEDVSKKDNRYISTGNDEYVKMCNEDKILLFAKRAVDNDSSAISFKYVGQILISKHAKLSELRATFSSERTEIFEILTPEEVNLLDRKNDDKTLDELELMSGDLICVQDCCKDDVQHHLKSIRHALEEELNTFEIKIYNDNEKAQSISVQVNTDMTYEELSEVVAKELVKNKWETNDLKPLTLQFVPWDPSSSLHFYGDTIEYEDNATLKQLLVPYGYSRMCKSFKYERLPLAITEIGDAETLDIVLVRNNTKHTVRTTYLKYGSTFVDVFEQLERYGLLKATNCDERFRMIAIRDRRVIGFYNLDTSLDPMLSQSLVQQHSGRDEILIEEKNVADDSNNNNNVVVQVLSCCMGERVVQFGFPRCVGVSKGDTVSDLKNRLGIKKNEKNDDDILVMCDEIEGSKSRSVKDKIVLKDDDVLFKHVPGIVSDDGMIVRCDGRKDAVPPIVYVQYKSRKCLSSTVVNDGIKIK